MPRKLKPFERGWREQFKQTLEQFSKEVLIERFLDKDASYQALSDKLHAERDAHSTMRQDIGLELEDIVERIEKLKAKL